MNESEQKNDPNPTDTCPSVWRMEGEPFTVNIGADQIDRLEAMHAAYKVAAILNRPAFLTADEKRSKDNALVKRRAKAKAAAKARKRNRR